MKHLPITIVGPINATPSRNGACGSHAGIWRALESLSVDRRDVSHYFFFMLSRSGKKEGIDFKHNKWILFIILAAVAGASKWLV